MERIPRPTAVEYFLGLDLPDSGRRSRSPPPPPFPPSPPSSPWSSRAGGFAPPLPPVSSMMSSISSRTGVPAIDDHHFNFDEIMPDVRAERAEVRSLNHSEVRRIDRRCGMSADG